MFFVDANVVVYAATSSHYRRDSQSVLAAVRDGAPGVTSVMVLEEIWHIEKCGRIPDMDGAAADALQLFEAPLPVTGQILRRAFALGVERLGTADRIHVATCHEAGITDIVTADRGFDDAPGLRRVDPKDEVVVGELLNG